MKKPQPDISEDGCAITKNAPGNGGPKHPKRGRPRKKSNFVENKRSKVWTTEEKRKLLAAIKKASTDEFDYAYLQRSVPTRSIEEIIKFKTRLRNIVKLPEKEIVTKKSTAAEKRSYAPIESWTCLLKELTHYEPEDYSQMMTKVFSLITASEDDSHDPCTPNYKALYGYILACLKGQEPPELSLLDSEVMLELMKSLADILRNSDTKAARSLVKWKYKLFRRKVDVYNIREHTELLKMAVENDFTSYNEREKEKKKRKLDSNQTTNPKPSTSTGDIVNVNHNSSSCVNLVSKTGENSEKEPKKGKQRGRQRKWNIPSYPIIPAAPKPRTPKIEYILCTPKVPVKESSGSYVTYEKLGGMNITKQSSDTGTDTEKDKAMESADTDKEKGSADEETTKETFSNTSWHKPQGTPQKEKTDAECASDKSSESSSQTEATNTKPAVLKSSSVSGIRKGKVCTKSAILSSGSEQNEETNTESATVKSSSVSNNQKKSACTKSAKSTLSTRKQNVKTNMESPAVESSSVSNDQNEETLPKSVIPASSSSSGQKGETHTAHAAGKSSSISSIENEETDNNNTKVVPAMSLSSSSKPNSTTLLNSSLDQPRSASVSKTQADRIEITDESDEDCRIIETVSQSTGMSTQTDVPSSTTLENNQENKRTSAYAICQINKPKLFTLNPLCIPVSVLKVPNKSNDHKK